MTFLPQWRWRGADSGAAKSIPPSGRGYSQLDWLQRSRQLAVRPSSALREIGWEEVRRHRSAGDAWTVVCGRVYDLTPYLQYHPGGVEVLLREAVGGDATAGVERTHPWVNVELILRPCLLGTVRGE